MANTYGLTHIALAVREPEAALRFYAHVFGMQEYYRDASSIHALNPQGKEIITFIRDASLAGRPGGVLHFGFRLHTPEEIDAVILEIQRAGGKILRRGEFSPGFPFVFASDPDGYEIEIWYE
jgi:catechol 2,3-dioxygenase-like lactoylglutathione lyase family enzyme